MEKFETISDQIIQWANKSVDEKDGRTLIQVIRLVFEKATDEAAWSEMYARLCRKMMEQISPEVQDQGIKNMEGKPIRGGHLFRKYLLNRCQEDFERGWFAKEVTATSVAAKASDNQAAEAVHEKQGTSDAGFHLNEYYAAQKAKRQGLGLITFIGELFKVRMLTERIMHECVKKLFGNVENPEEEEIESLCQLLKTVGQLLDTPKASAHMDVYFTRMKELGKSHNISTRMRFMLQDVIELRDRAWMSRDTAPMTIAAVHVLAAKERLVAEECPNREMCMSRDGSRDRNQEDGLDGWAVAGDYVPQSPPKTGDLSPLRNITNGPPMASVTGPSGIFGATMEDSKQEALLQTNSSSNMSPMLSKNAELTAEASTKPSRSSSRKPSIDLGHDRVPEPAVQHNERESAPTAMSEADIKKEIDRYVRAFFTVHNLQEADVYVTNLPHELCFRLVDNRKTSMSRGGPRGGSEHQEHGPDGWAAPGGSVPWALPKAGDLSQFGKISVGAPMVMSPSSALAGRKEHSERQTPSQLNSSSNMFHMLSQNPELTPETSIKSICPSDWKPGVDNLGHVSVAKPAVPHREYRIIPTAMSEEAVKKKIDEDVKEFFAVRSLREADNYFPNLPDEHRFRLVDKLVASALKSKVTDARLVGDFFAQAMNNGQCPFEVFEKGFMPMAEFLNDVVIDAPRAFVYMAIMLRGAGFQNEPERLHRIASKLEDSDKLVSLVA
ncbi:ARM repeat-containing protein [Suillus weaverae]|nr:ARM repeat-containing protein [Suillus weaverae]